MTEEQIQNMTAEERKALIERLQREEREEKLNRRNAYETLRTEFVNDVWAGLIDVTNRVSKFREGIENETKSFYEVMREYGHLRKADQQSFTIIDGERKIVVKSNKVKGFDERADVAAERLIDYLRAYIERSEKGTEDPMYQLGMTLLERNRQGELDYKSISKLYELEDKFDGEYREIMELFRESNVVYSTSINYYFYRKDALGVWRQIEPSFCRL